jgi:short-subunit dehydrogenase
MAIAISRKFALNKYNIQIAGRNMNQLKSIQSDLITRYNVSCSIFQFDAVNFESHSAFFENLITKPDVTISVFGLLGENELARVNWSHAESIIHTNFTGAVSILNIVSNYYESLKKGVIVGISSVAGERGRQSNYIYGSAKAGFTTYLSGLRNRLYKENVHVITVKPGFVYTKMTENLNLPKLLTAKPEEVADHVYKAVLQKRDVIYIRWIWKWIMLVIKTIPEFIFKKLKL